MALENTTEATISRHSHKTRDGLYYQSDVALAGGVPNQLVDIDTDLTAQGRGDTVGPARYLSVTTDVNITVSINSASADAIVVTSTAALTIPLGVLAIYRLYLSHSGACGAGAATVRVFAS